MGASAKWLGIESETRLQNKGVSACATCDGALFRGKPMAVVGGGDTAIEEALFLTRFATKVTLIHRRGELRASKIMQERARANPKIEFAWNAAVEEVLGDEFVTGVRVRDVKTDEVRSLPIEALFVAIGHQPNTSLVRGQIALDPVGYIQVRARHHAHLASRGSSPAATRWIRSIARRSPRRAPAAWPRSTPSAGSPSTESARSRVDGALEGDGSSA